MYVWAQWQKKVNQYEVGLLKSHKKYQTFNADLVPLVSPHSHLHSTSGFPHSEVEFLCLGGISTKRKKQLFFNLGELIKHHIQIMRRKCSESRDAYRLIKVKLCRFLLYFSSLVCVCVCVCVHSALKITQQWRTPPPHRHQSNHSEWRSGKCGIESQQSREESDTSTHGGCWKTGRCGVSSLTGLMMAAKNRQK